MDNSGFEIRLKNLEEKCTELIDLFSEIKKLRTDLQDLSKLFKDATEAELQDLKNLCERVTENEKKLELLRVRSLII